jgi:hypothetical protein
VSAQSRTAPVETLSSMKSRLLRINDGLLSLGMIWYEPNRSSSKLRSLTEKYSVGILLFGGVEVLDFAGPFEVFSRTRLSPGVESRRSDDAAPFRVFTVAKEDGPVTTTGELKVMPHYSFETAPPIASWSFIAARSSRAARWQTSNHALGSVGSFAGNQRLARSRHFRPARPPRRWRCREPER